MKSRHKNKLFISVSQVKHISKNNSGRNNTSCPTNNISIECVIKLRQNNIQFPLFNSVWLHRDFHPRASTRQDKTHWHVHLNLIRYNHCEIPFSQWEQQALLCFPHATRNRKNSRDLSSCCKTLTGSDPNVSCTVRPVTSRAAICVALNDPVSVKSVKWMELEVLLQIQLLLSGTFVIVLSQHSTALCIFFIDSFRKWTICEIKRRQWS